jgi:hypothetical protein
MSTPKGYPSSLKEDRLETQHTTVEPVRELQNALTTISHVTVMKVAADFALSSGCTTKTLIGTDHGAKRGDVIYFRSGALDGLEVKVWAAPNNFTIELAEALPAAPAAGDLVDILRHKFPVVDDEGNLAISSGPVRFVKNGFPIEVREDSLDPSNNVPLPVKLTSVTGDINITANDLHVQLSHTGPNYDATRIGDGTYELEITNANEAKVKDVALDVDLSTRATEETLAALESKDFATEATLSTIATEETLAALEAKDFATETTLASLEAKDFATETTLSALEAKDFATETTLADVLTAVQGSLSTITQNTIVISEHDHIAMTYVASGDGEGEIQTVTYKTGGASGTTVATLTLTYDASNRLSSVTRS